MRKKWIDRNEKLGLRLTLVERKLILEDPIHIHDEIADPIRATPTGDPVLSPLINWKTWAVTSQPKPTIPRTRSSEKGSPPPIHRMTASRPR